MKIIVSSKQEKDLIKRFLTAMREMDGIDTIISLDAEVADGEDEFYFKTDDEKFLEDAINSAKIEIDEKIYPLCIEHYQITGTCVICGTQTEGTIDGEDVSYDDYLDMMSPQHLKEWKCESCLEKERRDAE
jgi:hypothetical protein